MGPFQGPLLYVAGLLAALAVVSGVLLRVVSKDREHRKRLHRVLEERRRHGVGEE
ncbi:MAG: hypothetical protein U0Q12_00420 [Vicinamibacterales bacterium]